MHPELALEDDVEQLLVQHEELARLLAEKAEVGHGEMGTRLFEELERLRDLRQRRDLEIIRDTMEWRNVRTISP